MKRGEFQDSSVGRFLTALYDLVVVNVLWLVFSLPLVTLGAATTAMYTVTLRMARGEPVSTLHEFLKAFRANFKPSLPILGVGVLGSVLLSGDAWFAAGQEGGIRVLFLVVSACIGALTFSVLAWGFSLLAAFENTPRVHLRNSLALAIGFPGKTLRIWLYWAVPAAVLLVVPPAAILLLVPFYVVLGGALPCYLSARQQIRVYDKMLGNQTEKDPQ